MNSVTHKTHPHEEKQNFTAPEISEDGKTVRFKGKVYHLHKISRESALWMEGTTHEHFDNGLMTIKDNEIWYTSTIPWEYLPYAVIQEIECPNMEILGTAVPAMEEELKYVPQNILWEYLMWRLHFFENVSSFWEQFQNDWDERAQKYYISCQAVVSYLKTRGVWNHTKQILSEQNV